MPIPKDSDLVGTSKVNRVEVIDPTGRAYVHWTTKARVSIDLQDDGRTLKVFIE